jgi:hypothetical protein
MGLLSKIFDTDKLEYILREEEEFSVTAPQQWNVETLTVGDTITPDMFKDQYRFYDFDLYIKEIGYDDEYEYDDDMEGDFYVTTEFDNSAKKYLHNQHTWWFHEINDYLKPEYKVVTTDLSESEDEFNVAAPPEWNEIELGVGDLITPENSTTGNYYLIKSIGDNHVWVRKGTLDYNGEFKPQHSVDFHTHLNAIKKRMKPGFTITQNKNLNEVEDEFNVNAPEDWNVTELGVGDIITGNMFQTIEDTRHWMDNVKKLEILKFSNFGDHGIVNLSLPNQNEIYVSWVVDNVNEDLKSNYRIALPLTESDEEWTVDEPSSEWNVEMLTVGDTITPDMLKPNNEIYDSQENLYITKIGRYTDGLAAVLRNSKGERNLHYLENINNALKPQYKIYTYLKESDEDFSVEAPSEWDVTELKVGDFITPDMWEINEYDFNIQRKTAKITDIGVDDKGPYVVLAHENWSLDYDTDIINDLLKPQYKIEQNLTESDDEFSVDAPEEWDVTELGVGDIITNDMWNPNTTKGKHFFDWIAFEEDGWEIIGIENDQAGDDRFYVTIMGIDSKLDFSDWLDKFNDYLKPQFKIHRSLNESEDEFNVTAPKEWNIQILYDGDLITPDMWNRENLFLDNYIYDPNQDWTIIAEEDPNYVILNSKGGVKIGFTKDTVNSLLKPEYKISLPNLNESDEFTVDAPESWNVTELGVGDYITPEMIDTPKDRRRWTSFHKVFGDPKRAPGWKIVKFINEELDNVFYVKLEHNGVKDIFSIKSLNKKIKPQFKIVPPTNETKLSSLLEQDDEFNVDAPTEWNVELLTVGDYITPDMWQDEVEETFADFKQGKLFKKLITKPVKIDYVLEGDNIYFTVEGVDLAFTNDVLLPQYQVVKDKNIFESEDEFNVNAPTKWNVTELTVGDEIEPHMWDLNNIDLYDFIDDPNENWIIDKINDRDIQIVTETGGETWCRVDDINGILKPEYKIVEFLSESEDEFSVEAPKQWNVETLTVGDTITPDMWNKQKFINDGWFGEEGWFGLESYNKTIQDSYLIQSMFFDEGDEDFEADWQVNLNSTTTGKSFNIIGDSTPLKILNSLLKDNYKVYSPEINESEDDFNVDAPSEWNASDLEVGSIVTPDMWDETLKDAIFFQDRANTVLSKPHTITKIKYAPIGGNKYFDLYFNFDGEQKSIHSSYLKPQYHLFKELNESEEEDFSVEAPVEWNQEYLTAGDTITPEMWDVSKLGRRKDYFEKPIKIDWIGYNEFDDEEVELLVGLDLGGLGIEYDINFINDLLKPEFKVVQNKALNEEEEEFNVDAPTEWNYELLTIGDTITPDMWDDDVTNLSSIKQFNHVLKKPFTIKGISRSDLGGGVYYSIQLDDDTYIHSSFLKPQYQITPNLSENDDEFSVDAPENWNVEELGIGSILDPSNLKMQNYSKKYEIIDFKKSVWGNDVIVKVFELVEEPIPGTIRTTRQWKHTKNSSINLKTLNDYLKDNYKIISTLSESDDDEFNVEAPKSWNQHELKVGDYFNEYDGKVYTHKEDIPGGIFKPSTYEVIYIGPNEGEYYNPNYYDNNIIVFRSTYNKKNTYSFTVDYFNESRGLKLNAYINYPDKMSNLNESEDEFTVKAPKGWDVTYLRVGDTITPDMWNKREIKQVTSDVSFDEPLKIKWIGTDGFDGVIEFEGYDSDYLNVEFIHDILKPKYRISLSNINESDDEFNVDAPEDWNIQYLGVGDTIQGKMWNWENIITWCNRVAGDNNVELNELIRRWEDVYDEGATIDRIIKYGDYHHVEFDSDSGFLRFGPNVSTVNNWLSDGYEIEKSLTEEAEDFNVIASPKWDIIELGVGDYINSNMLNPKGNDYIWFSRRKLFIEDIYFDECWTVNLLHVESNYHTAFCIDYINEDVLNNKYKIMTSLKELSKLLEVDDEFNVEAPKEWNVQELGIGDKITRDMIKNPVFLDQMDEDFRMDFPGVITNMYRAGVPGDEYWGVRIKFQDVGWRKYLPKSKDIKLGLGFTLDSFNQNTLKPQYQIQKPVFELSSLLENEEDFNVNAPDEWNVELLTVGDTITPDMWGYDGIFFDVSKPLTIEDIGEDEGGWWIQLGRSEAPFDLDEINEYLKSKYRVVPYILEELDDEFSVNAPEEWNITQLGVNDVITPDMWSKKGIKTSLIINKIEKRGIIDGNEWWEIHMKPYGSKPLQNNEKSSIIVDLNDVQNHLKPEYKIIKNKVIFEEEDFNVNAPEEWNEEYWEDYGGVEEDVYSSFQNFVYRVLKKREIEDEFIETYLDEIFNYGDISDYINISSSKLIDDFNVWVDAQDSDSDWYVDMNESDDEFNVSAPEEWWEYDGDVEIMFQDTYWYEDENGKEAIVERDGGGILNINDLEQYSYSGWKPFTGSPTNENLKNWWYSIDWDTDLIEIFSFDDSIFEVEEDFEWSTAENVDMDRTGFRIRAVSTLKEVEDEFTVKPSKKWDIVYLNKGDFLDNTNSTFNDPNVKYEIGNITSDGEIEVKKYINRGDNFEPQFDRFMKTRKGIVKAKLKSGFDIETSSK